MMPATTTFRRLLACLCLALAAAPVKAREIVAGTELDPFTPRHNAVVGVGGCTGTLISDDVVLAASHCFPPGQRQERPPEAEMADCAGLEQQAQIESGSWEDPYAWYPSPRPKTILFGNDRKNIRLTRKAVAYALPRCADMVLMKLDLAPPRYIAQPLPVLMAPPPDPDRLFSLAPMRHAGWGRMQDGTSPDHLRKSGNVDYWGSNHCHLIALPPLRDGKHRVLTGDSGSPLLWETGDGEVVIGVLWGFGYADFRTCGPVVPPPPKHYGSYTPTFRPMVPGTASTDIGDWLRRMVPEAEYRPDRM